MKFLLLCTLAAVTLVAPAAMAQNPSTVPAEMNQTDGPMPDEALSQEMSAFRDVLYVPPTSIVVPTVVELDVSSQIMPGSQVAVYEVETQQFTAALVERVSETIPTQWQVQATPPTTQSLSWLVDANQNTAIDFALTDSDQRNSVSIRLRSSSPITTSELLVQLAQYVALPLTVAIQAEVQGDLTTLVAPQPMTRQSVRFPEITAQAFVVTLTYAQPLRITEMSFAPVRRTQATTQTVRFLAQPGNSYEVYLNPDRPVQIEVGEGGDLRSDEGVQLLSTPATQLNPVYQPADVDADMVRDLFDNCVEVFNPEQTDIDNNGRGDACDDFDRDGVINSLDNCVNQPNRNQSDEDGDGIGDACDEEESRFTERNAWVPWVGIGTAALVIIVLFSIVALHGRPEPRE